MTTQTTTYQGPGCLTLLGLIFITLKLTGHITWSWFWVLSPFILIAFIVLIFLSIVLFKMLTYKK